MGMWRRRQRASLCHVLICVCVWMDGRAAAGRGYPATETSLLTPHPGCSPWAAIPSFTPPSCMSIRSFREYWNDNVWERGRGENVSYVLPPRMLHPIQIGTWRGSGEVVLTLSCQPVRTAATTLLVNTSACFGQRSQLTQRPSDSPTTRPTVAPTVAPTKQPSFEPTPSPNPNPSIGPTASPTQPPSMIPTTSVPTAAPTETPTPQPTAQPATSEPSAPPTSTPSWSAPTIRPTFGPTFGPTLAPSRNGVRDGNGLHGASDAATDTTQVHTQVIAAVALCGAVALGAAGLAVLAKRRARRASAEPGSDGSTPLAGVGVDLGGKAANGGAQRTRSQLPRDDGATDVSRQMGLSTPVTLPPEQAVTTAVTAGAGRAQAQVVAIEESGTGKPLALGIVPAFPAPASPTGVGAFGFDSAA